MSSVTVSTLRIMRESGHPETTYCTAAPVVDVKGKWQLCFGKSPASVTLTLESARGRRLFSTIDAACKTASQLGYTHCNIFMPRGIF